MWRWRFSTLVSGFPYAECGRPLTVHIILAMGVYSRSAAAITLTDVA